MKTYILFFTIFCLSSKLLYAQYKYTPAKIYLKSGEVYEGEVNLKVQNLRELAPSEEKVKFKKNDQKQTIEAKAIDSIVFIVSIEERKNKKKLSYKEQQTFIPVFTKKNKKYLRMVRLVIDDKIKLYSRSVKTGAAMNGNGSFAYYGGNNQYFVARKDDDIPLSLLPNGPKKFRKEASKFFSDCQDLVDKINTKIYNRTNIMEILNFYNTKCIN